MLESPNILHVILAFGGAGCLFAAMLETRRRTIKRWRLLWPPCLALAVAAVAGLAQIEMEQPIWPFAAVIAIGLAIGVVRGATISFKVDHYWSLIQVRRTSRRALGWVAAVVAADAILECAAAISGQPLVTWRFVGALAAAACTGMLWGRATGILARMRYAPHVDL